MRVVSCVTGKAAKAHVGLVAAQIFKTLANTVRYKNTDVKKVN